MLTVFSVIFLYVLPCVIVFAKTTNSKIDKYVKGHDITLEDVATIFSAFVPLLNFMLMGAFLIEQFDKINWSRPVIRGKNNG